MASKRRNMFHKNKTQETTEEAVPGEHPQVKDRQKAAPPKKRPPGVPAKETSGALKKEPKMPAKKAVPTELRHKKRKTSRVKVPTGAQTVDPQDWDRFGDKFTKRIAKYILDAPTNPDLQEANQHRRGPIKGRQSKEMRRRGAASSEEEDYWALGPFRDEAEDTRKSAVVEDAAERKRPAVLERSRKNASKKPSQELENKPKKKSHKTKHLGPRLPERETGVDDQGHFLGGGPRNTNMRDIRA
ncbi:hypothetical protein AAG570_007266 [Ranatra chinensis]|uniref:Uncharacterized protein n=1 Tax=Ranatra chinensis TaxID=642074 RepID=A0ABD0YJ55_9HEMI